MKERIELSPMCSLTSAFILMAGAAVVAGEPAPHEGNRASLESSVIGELAGREDVPRPASGPSTCSELSATAAASIGPDLIVGHVFACAVLGRLGAVGSGTMGMSCWTTACTIGDMGTNWYGVPSVDHPMISVNLFRQWRRDGSDRLEQIGRSWIKHGFGTENADDCGFGCSPGGHFNLNAPGCSDTYAASQFQACDLGPRSMIHPYTGVMPFSANLGASGGCAANYLSNDHRDHVHNGISHRVQVQDVDIAAANAGARFISEGQYVVPHEFVDGNGTQNNNVSHRRLLVNGPDPCGNVAFTDQGETFAQSPAIDAWSGASQTLIEPAPLVDGRGFLVYKVTPLGGMWRYEYALYNMNMDRSFGSLSIPLPAGAVVSNVGSHFPLNHAPEPHTENYSNAPWSVSTSGGAVTWETSSFGSDPLANAVRWGSMYNFYFDANTPPTAADATVGLFKTGGTAVAAALAPGAGPVDCNSNTIEDRCDVSCALPGCLVPGCGTKTDCNANFVPDDCEPDCNSNGIVDRCDLTANPGLDCDANAIPDSCEPFTDCNGNSVRDACEVYTNPGNDVDGDGLPDDCAPPLSHVWFVDDDGPGDPFPGSTFGSDPLENGTLAHPFDAMQEAINLAAPGDLVVVRDGVFRGVGNTFLNFLQKPIVLRSEHGPESTTVDLEFSRMFIDLDRGGPAAIHIQGFHIINLRIGQSPPPVILCGAGASPTIQDCVFTVVGANNGTAAFQLFSNSRPVISHCRFENVRTAIETFNGRPLIDNCVIDGASTGVSVNGGDGSTGCITSSSARIVNTTISRCDTGVSVPAGNFADIENSIIWGNTTAQISATPSSAAVVSYSDVQGGWAGIGNIDADPMFLDALAADYRIFLGSPCIDAGDSTLPDLSATDQDGGPRSFDDPATVDTGVGSPPIVDMGADEWADCNGNLIEDSMEITNGTAPDCNRNRVPDACESLVDCNANTTQDTCDVLLGTSGDCNVNSIPDECDTGIGGGSNDCNANTVPDECELDCQPNGVPDDCDITLGTSLDCSGNGVPNECEPDCQPNGVADDCDITGGTSRDQDNSGIPDECEALPAPNIIWDLDPLSPTRATRTLTMSVAAAATATGGTGSAAMQIKMVDLQHANPKNRPQFPPPNFTAFDTATNGVCAGATTGPNFNEHHCDTSTDCLGPNNAIATDDGTCGSFLACTAAGEANSCVRWVGPVATFREKQDVLSLGTYRAARLQCTPYYRDWTTEGVFTVFGAELLPSSTYEGQTFGWDCKGMESTCTNVSPPVTLFTRRSGDTAATWNPPGVTDQPDGADVVAVLNKFKGLGGSPSNATALLQPNAIDPNVDVSGSDIVATVDAFKGLSYPFSGPCICPSTVICGALECPPGNCGAGVCVKTCVGGTNAGLPCGDNTHDHCPGGTCPSSGFCRDRCGRCTP